MIRRQLAVCALHVRKIGIWWKSRENTTRRFIYLAGVLALCGAVPAPANILYESATNGGGPTTGGVTIFSTQFIASEFTLHSAATITNITGEVASITGFPNIFFMTLLHLSGPGLPNNLIGDPFGGTPQLYTTTFSGGPAGAANEVSFPVSVSVSAGTYAVVFGSGLFGSPAAEGYMPGTGAGNIVLPGANLFTWYDSTGNSDYSRARWTESGNGGQRFVVEGIPIPEPSSLALIVIACASLGIGRLRAVMMDGVDANAKV
jgi:hypothetical protein